MIIIIIYYVVVKTIFPSQVVRGGAKIRLSLLGFWFWYRWIWL